MIDLALIALAPALAFATAPAASLAPAPVLALALALALTTGLTCALAPALAVAPALVLAFALAPALVFLLLLLLLLLLLPNQGIILFTYHQQYCLTPGRTSQRGTTSTKWIHPEIRSNHAASLTSLFGPNSKYIERKRKLRKKGRAPKPVQLCVQGIPQKNPTPVAPKAVNP